MPCWALRRNPQSLLPKKYAHARLMGLDWWVEGTKRQQKAGAGHGVAELRTNQLWVPDGDTVTSMLKPLWPQLCVPSWTPTFLWKRNHQHGLPTKSAYPQCIPDLMECQPWAPCPDHLGLHSFLFPSPCQRWHHQLAAAPELGNPRWIRDLQPQDKTFSGRSLAT